MLVYNYRNNHKEKTILLLHGLGGNNSCFKHQLEICNDTYNILQIDLHGHGLSKNHKLSNLIETSFDLVCEDVNVVLSILNLEKVDVLSFSLGTMVSNVFITLYPEKIDRVIHIGSLMEYSKFVRFSIKLLNELKNYLPYIILYSIASTVIMPRYFHIKSRKIFIKEAVKLSQAEFNSWIDIISSYYDLYTLESFSDNNIKKLYLSGEYDIFNKSVVKYCALDKNSICRIIKKAGHVCNVDKYKEVNDCIIQFLKS